LVEISEDVAEDFEGRQGTGGGVSVDEKVIEGECVYAGRKVFKLGVDFEADKVANDQEGRVVESFVILVELLVGLL
jgi:hypothetical protein